MQMHSREGRGFAGFLTTAFFLTENVAPQFVAGTGSDLAACSPPFASVTFLDVGLNGRSHGGSRARCVRRGFCSCPSERFQCSVLCLLEGKRPAGRLVIDVVGD